MELIIKELENENHIYLMDINMRPLNIEVVSKFKTNDLVKSLVLNNKISNILVTDSLDFSNKENYIIDHI